MGAFTSRMSTGVEEVDYSTTSAYRYPPKSGCYFGSYFIMGGERFDTTQPEAYLFGENQDLNFLGNRPMPFPYPAPQANEPTKTLKSLVNIRKDSLRFLKVIDEELGATKLDKPEGEPQKTSSTRYNIEFTFDTDVRVAITIYYFAAEEISNGQATYNPKDASMNSETYHYKRGANQTFSQTTHILDPSKFSEEEWQYNPDKEVIPVVIHCIVEDEPEHNGHSHITFAVVEKSTEPGYSLKPLKQKQMVDGLCYLLQEIYGIENKNSDRGKAPDDDIDDNGSECVICMSDIRDTLILPCRHLCLCNCCADSLRYQANNCPICRAPFRALLQIRAMRKKLPGLPPQTTIPNGDSEENQLSQEGVPPGYEAVSLLEALNGPSNISSPPNNNPHQDGTVPVIPLGTSLPTSPEDSPIMEKRKKSRQSSIRSRQSVAAPLVEEAEESREEETERSATPEVSMTAIPEVVVKANKPEPPSDIPLTRSKNKSAVIGRVPSVEIINETKSDKVLPSESQMHTVAGAVGGEERPATPSPDYEDAIEGPMVMFAGPMVEVEVKKPHTAVMYVGKEENAGEVETDTCLPSQVPEDVKTPTGSNASTASADSNMNGALMNGSLMTGSLTGSVNEAASKQEDDPSD